MHYFPKYFKFAYPQIDAHIAQMLQQQEQVPLTSLSRSYRVPRAVSSAFLNHKIQHLLHVPNYYHLSFEKFQD